MRTLFLALMIALLPVRGWLGDAMAIEMVRHAMPAAEAVAGAAQAATEAHCHEAGDMAMNAMDGASHDNHAMADGHGDDSGTHSGSDSDHASHQGCGTCTACQVCHSVALGGTELRGIAHDAPQAAPAAPAARFASTEPSLGLKPPIS